MPRSSAREVLISIPEDDLLDEETIANYLNIPARTVATLLDSDRMPFVRVVSHSGQKRIHWKGLMILAWLFESGEIEKVFGDFESLNVKKPSKRLLKNLGGTQDTDSSAE